MDVQCNKIHMHIPHHKSFAANNLKLYVTMCIPHGYMTITCYPHKYIQESTQPSWAFLTPHISRMESLILCNIPCPTPPIPAVAIVDCSLISISLDSLQESVIHNRGWVVIYTSCTTSSPTHCMNFLCQSATALHSHTPTKWVQVIC